jgi:mRNA interferase MazF
MAAPLRGEIWMIDLDPTRGHEQAGKRPGLIVSDDVFNSGPAGLVIVLPLTTKSKGIRSHVEVRPPDAGLRKTSFIKCEDVRSVSVERLGKRLGTVSPPTMEAVALRMRILMDL